jgi:catechol 2,3-dioxygenase-like lactoylglutathione lyase family enzyme
MAPLLQVFDMPTSVRFYRDVLGFEIVGTDGKPADDFDWVLLRLHGIELMLNTAYEANDRPPAPDPARVAAHRDTAIFFGCPDVDATFAFLRSRGVAAREPVNTHYGFRSMTLPDPDGYDLVFHWPLDPTRAGWT